MVYDMCLDVKSRIQVIMKRIEIILTESDYEKLLELLEDAENDGMIQDAFTIRTIEENINHDEIDL